jgi:hypothetical protein
MSYNQDEIASGLPSTSLPAWYNFLVKCIHRDFKSKTMVGIFNYIMQWVIPALTASVQPVLYNGSIEAMTTQQCKRLAGGFTHLHECTDDELNIGLAPLWELLYYNGYSVIKFTPRV